MLYLAFGTFYMPAGVLPDRYGIGDGEFPTAFGAQLMQPFKNKAAAARRKRRLPSDKWIAAAAKPAASLLFFHQFTVK